MFANLTLDRKVGPNQIKKELIDHLNSGPLRLQARNLAGERFQRPKEMSLNFFGGIFVKW